MEKPQRWDQPFDSDMTDADVASLMEVSEISAIDAESFPRHVPLEGVLKNDSRIVRFAPGEIVVREGDYGNSAFLVLKGKLRVVLSPSLSSEALGRVQENKRSLFSAVSQLWSSNWLPETRDPKKFSAGKMNARRASPDTRVVLQDIPAVLDKHNTAVMIEGSLFGELAALGRIPRTASIFADEQSELLEIRWQGLRELRAYDEGWKRMIDQRYRESALKAHLRESDEFRNLTDEQITAVADKCIFETYGSFDWYTSFQRMRAQGTAEEPVIARQGEYPDGLLMIRAGFARESVKHGNSNRTVTYLGAGDNFGLYELYSAWKDPEATDLALEASLNAIGYVDVVRVPATVLAEHVFPNMAPPEDKIKVKTEKSVVDDALIEWAVDERFINGRQTMMVDLNNCTRCDDCVRACATAHDGNPRFRRHGKIVEHWMVANACMHCEDPVCMIGCPTVAIHRSISGGTVVINDNTCIGCGTCANSCPYDNISLVQISDRQGAPLVDDATHRPIMKATKCDLCADQLGGPACVRACPHDALRRADFREFAN